MSLALCMFILFYEDTWLGDSSAVCVCDFFFIFVKKMY